MFEFLPDVNAIVMEYCVHGSLQDWIDQKFTTARLDLRMVVQIATQMARALEDLHDQAIVHCDLRARNVLVCNLSSMPL